jgi:hypothetical protein
MMGRRNLRWAKSLGAVVTVLLFCVPNARVHGKDIQVEKWDMFELNLEGPRDGNPYLDVGLTGVFKKDDRVVRTAGFYDGQGRYILRFSPDAEGPWTYQIQSNAPQLSGKKGHFVCTTPTGNNHGPLRIVNTYYLEYADGTPFYAVGTTCYQWTSVSQDLQKMTLQTLAQSPFNKVRMCVFPKHYSWNLSDPWAFPYVRNGQVNDYTRPDYAFFRNFDRRIAQLNDLGIQADVILFHSYDRWGYANMGKQNDDRYVKYMIARIGAYRNVWWSLANEWDLMVHNQHKTEADFDRFFRILKEDDPHHRFRGIHNWYDTEDHFYDHNKPGVTHASIQSSRFFQGLGWRARYSKPLLWDEVRYEGNVPTGWGNLTPEMMTAHFWMGGLTGGYVTHGECYRTVKDKSDDVLWWGKGGQLKGQSPARIAFFRKIMEALPIKEMEPTLAKLGEGTGNKGVCFILAKPGHVYLGYTLNENRLINLDLEGSIDYKIELIDTWDMTIKDLGTAKPGRYTLKTTAQYQAIRATRQ